MCNVYQNKLRSSFNNPPPPTGPGAVIQTIVSSILQSGRITATRLKSPSPLMYTYYNSLCLGAAHGLSSILQMLLTYSRYLDAEAMKDVKAACYCLLSCETERHNYPACLNETSDDLWHWCHGSPGVVYCLIKAHQVLKVISSFELGNSMAIFWCEVYRIRYV